MRDDLVEVICILDRSGSMEKIASDAIGGFNNLLKEQKELDGEVNMTLVLFDHEYDLVHDCVDIQKVPDLTKKEYFPRGLTAYRDAVGRTIDSVGKRLTDMDEKDRPFKVIVAIVTDGLENASKEYSPEQIKEKIKTQQEQFKWEFLFLAANQDAIEAGAALSIGSKHTFNYSATSKGTRSAYSSLSNVVGMSRSGKTDYDLSKLQADPDKEDES